MKKWLTITFIMLLIGLFRFREEKGWLEASILAMGIFMSKVE